MEYEPWLDLAIPLLKHFEGLGPNTDKKTYCKAYTAPEAKKNQIKPYGVTIGWGHVVQPGEEEKYLGPGVTLLEAKNKLLAGDKHFIDSLPKLSLTDATELLYKDIDKFSHSVTTLLKRPPTPGQKAAMVCLAYNIGMGDHKQKIQGFSTSTLLLLYNAGKDLEASTRFAPWCYSNGKQLNGLKRRRKCESMLFLGWSIEQLNKKQWFTAEFK